MEHQKFIIINGPMGSGKSAVSQKLIEHLPNSVFLDGDWCWFMHHQIINQVTKDLVISNIVNTLNNYLKTADFDYIVFAWVIPNQDIYNLIMSQLDLKGAKPYFFSLIISDEILLNRLKNDLKTGKRKDPEVITRSLKINHQYLQMDSIIIMNDTSSLEEVVNSIKAYL